MCKIMRRVSRSPIYCPIIEVDADKYSARTEEAEEREGSETRGRADYKKAEGHGWLKATRTPGESSFS